MIKQIPEFETDEEPEAFIDGDLSDLDFSQFKPVRFESIRTSVEINLLLAEDLLLVVKQRSAARGIPYTSFIREAIEQAIANEAASGESA